MSQPFDLRSAQGLLALQCLPRVGPVTALRVALSGRVPPSLGANSGRIPNLSRAYEWAGRELVRHSRAGVEAVTFFDPNYPPRLSEIADPPIVLFVRGSTPILTSRRLVAVVGTRTPSQVGMEAARFITSALAERGWGIVSGLARGIDTVAHRTALERGAPTVAILGNGLDRIYPKENAPLAQEIVASGGAVISEQPFGAPPISRNLIARDRLQSGSAIALVVAQTGIEGGAMHTVRFAAEQGRPVFCPVLKEDGATSEGLRVLLERPANTLCELVPSWGASESLCRRLGPDPLAHGLMPEDIIDFLDHLEAVFDQPPGSEQQNLLVPNQID